MNHPPLLRPPILIPRTRTMKSPPAVASRSMAVMARDRSKNRKPTQRGRYLSIEGIQAVQALNCANKTVGDSPSLALETKVRRLVKFDKTAALQFGFQPNQHFGRTSLRPSACVHRQPSYPSKREDYTEYSQNVDLPTIQPKKKKKPFSVPIKKLLQAGRKDKKMAQMGIEKPLEPPKNGILVPDLIPVAHEVLELWKELIKGVSQLLQVVSVYGCSKCAEVHIGPTGHQIPDCRGTGNVHRRSQHAWVRGTINDILLPIESYHLFDPFGRRIRHETRFNYDRVPALVELCIQAGVDLPEYPSRRRTMPIRMLGKKVIDRGGFVDEPKPYRSDDGTSLLSQIDTYGALNNQAPLLETDTRRLAERTLKVYNKVRRGVTKLMKKYTVKACGYCSEVHVGPWGHNTKLCGAFKHQWRDGKHGWQDATVDEVFPPNYVWHVRDPEGPPLAGRLKKFYGKAPVVVELCVQAGAEIPDSYRPMMRVDIVVPDTEEARLVA